MNLSDCHNDNRDYTARYDRAAQKARNILGSYDKIAQEIYARTGNSVAGASVRRWFVQRTTPVHIACILSDLTGGEVQVLDFFPYLENYVDPDFLS